MCEPRDALEVRVDDEAGDRDRPEPAHDRVELPDRNEEERERRKAEEHDLERRQAPRRQLPPLGPRVARIDLRVDEPVQRHRQRPGTDHRQRDPEQVVRRRDPVDGEQRTDVGERQREDRVLDLDERGEATGQRGHGPAVMSAGVARPVAGEQLERVAQSRLQHGETVAAPAGRAGEVDHERRPDHACDPTREERVRRPGDRVGPDRLGDARRGAIEHPRSSLPG